VYFQTESKTIIQKKQPIFRLRMKQVVIIGNGITGITAARYIRKNSDARIVVISSESEHFYSRTALMYIFMGHLTYEHTKPYEDWFWKKNNIELIKGKVTEVHPDKNEILLSDHTVFQYDYLVLATGSRYKKIQIPGSDLKGIGGLFSLQDLEELEENCSGVKNAVVIGGGLIGMEIIEMLASRKIEVFFLVREFKFWSNVLPPEESTMIQEHMRDHHIHILLHTEVVEIKGDENGRVKSVITSEGQELKCQLVATSIGVEPNIEFLKKSGISIGKGIRVNSFLETNYKNIFAGGDSAEFDPPLKGRPAVEQIWYTGRMHGECIGKTIAGLRTEYKPINFYNSAKLLDIEFQMYSEEVLIPKNAEHIFWKSDNGLKSIRIYFEKNTGRFLALISLGIRYRHEVCDRWLTEKRSVEFVLENLSEANFDPEFYKRYENEIIFIYNNKYGRNIRLQKK
jgi:NADH oxidase (H2O2-forming)